MTQSRIKLKHKHRQWASQLHNFQEQALSIRKMQDSAIRNIPITIDQFMTQQQMRINRRAQILLEATNSEQPQGTFLSTPEHKNIKDFICDNINLEHQKYAAFDSGSEHSSEDQIGIQFYSIQDIVDSAQKDPVPGRITFIIKVVRVKGLHFEFKVENVRPKGYREQLDVQLVKTCGNFQMYEIETNSIHKKIAISLMIGGETILRSEELSFASRSILLDLALSYDFDNDKRLELNTLEGLLAACVLGGGRLSREIVELNGQKAFKTEIVNKGYKVDKLTRQFIEENNQNRSELVRLLKLLLEEDQLSFGKPSRRISSPTYQTIAQFFLVQVLKFQSISSTDQSELTIEELLSSYEVYLHLICLNQLKCLDLDPQMQSNLLVKIGEIIQYCFRVKEVTLFHKFIDFCIKTGCYILPIGYDTIREYIGGYGINSADQILSNFENIKYHLDKNANQIDKVEVAVLLIKVFKGKGLESTSIYGKHIRRIQDYAKMVVKETRLSKLTVSQFRNFYSVYWMIKNHKELGRIVEIKEFKDQIIEQVKNLYERIRSAKEAQKIEGVKFLQQFFIQQRDQELIDNQMHFTNWVIYLFSTNCKNQQVLEALTELYFQMLKRTDTVFSQQLMNSTSKAICKDLLKLTPSQSLLLLNKYFGEDILNNGLFVNILTHCLLTPIIESWLPMNSKTVGLVDDGKHPQWHHNFIYQLYIKEMIVERILKVVNEKYFQSAFDKKLAITKIKNEINLNINDEDQRNTVLAIIEIEEIQLNQQKVWFYFTDQRGLLKTLCKILEKDDAKTEELRSSLKQIDIKLEKKNVAFEVVQKIKKMKPNEWYVFSELTKEYEIIDEIEQHFSKGKGFIEYLNRVKDFVRQISTRFQCPDGDKVMNCLENCLQKFLKQSIKLGSVEQFLPIFKNFKIQILKCYKLESFYGDHNLKGSCLDDVIKKSHELLDQLRGHLNAMVKDFESDSLKSSSFFFFKPKKESENQFIQILRSNYDDNTDTLDSLIEIYKLLARAGSLQITLGALAVVMDEKFGIRQPQLIQFHLKCKNITKSQDFIISDILANYKRVIALLKEFNIKLETQESTDLLDLFVILGKSHEMHRMLKTLEPHLPFIKEKVNDVGGQVTYDQLQHCQTVIQFMDTIWLQQGLLFTNFLNKINVFIGNKKQASKYFSLLAAFKAVVVSHKKLLQQMANYLDNSRPATKIIDQMVKKTKISFHLNKQNKDKIQSLIKIFPQGQARDVVERELMQSKQKAIMLMSSATTQEDKKRVKKIPLFLDICKSFESLKEKQQKLADWGYRQFKSEILPIQIVDSNTEQVKKATAQRDQTIKNWKSQVTGIYGIHYKSAHLQGKQLSQFYEFITKEENQIPANFQIINDNHEDHVKIKQQLKIIKGKTPEECLANVGNYFKSLKEKQQIEEAEDRDQEFVHYKIQSKEQADFMRGIQEIGVKRIQNIQFEHLLICTKETPQKELRSFVERSLRDPDSQYVILDFPNLDRTKQQYIIDEISTYRRQLKSSDQFKLKLCLVGNSQIQLLYKFSKENLAKADKKDKQTVSQCREVYHKRLAKQVQNLVIVTSERAGLGKSRYIQQDSHRKECKQLYHLPLSGSMFIPTEDQNEEPECEKFLWDRFKDAANHFRQVSKRSKEAKQPMDTALVLEIYNIEPPAIDSVNKFLSNIIFFRKHSYRQLYDQLPSNTRIYIELQNISRPISSTSKSNLPPQVQALPFLKQVLEICGKKVTQHIDDFKVDQVKIEKKDLQLHYILYYLKCLKDNTINQNFIKSIEQSVNVVEEAQGRKLLSHYFFDRFTGGDKPSGYLWTYFRALLLSSLNNYSKSVFLSKNTLQFIDEGLLKAKKSLHEELKLLQTFRRQFLQVLVDNCFQFIQRSVKAGAQNSAQSSLQGTLKQMPFLIIPDTQGQTFSFIYNNSQKVPKTIKNMIVLQEMALLNRVHNTSINDLFENQNIAKLQKQNPAEWKIRATRILRNISGNNTYDIQCEEGYVVNIDNFFKICLIAQRMRLNIPIVIMGEAGIGKTALLRHIVKKLYNNQFKVFNINAGLPLEAPKKDMKQLDAQKKSNSSLMAMVKTIEDTYKSMDKSLSSNGKPRKLWVFFDEFNTLKQLGFFKEIIIDKRFLGKKQDHFKNIVMMAACNPHKRLNKKTSQEKAKDQNYTLDRKEQKLAFDVLPTPHSLIECMWNYGALSTYEYQKYISKMLISVTYKTNELAKLILVIHKKIKGWLHDSAVSLRDIERLRQIYGWFKQNIARLKTKNIASVLGSYHSTEERALLMSLYFTYLLRFNFGRRAELEKDIEDHFGLNQGYTRAAKNVEESDFCSRLNIKWDTPLALNDSLKQNLYTCFVCVNTKLPLLIIGSPGSSKSLSLRLLTKNLGKCQDQYIKSFKAIRSYPIQGSENTVSRDIKEVFQKAQRQLYHKEDNRLLNLKDLRHSLLIVFDQIGLAEKSPDNPLKVLHPYLQVNREDQRDSRMMSFIGISNSQLDVSKMSRLLVLRRPPATTQDLTFTALSIAQGYKGTVQIDYKINFTIEKLTQTYANYLGIWTAKRNNFPLFYGLRDFYGLIKNFMSKVVSKQMNHEDDEGLVQAATESIFQNFNGWQETFQQFTHQFYSLLKLNQQIPEATMNKVIENLRVTLSGESNRYPMIIAEDEESQSFIKWIIERHFSQKSVYIEGSPFNEEKEYSLKLLGQICKFMEGEFVLIVSNLKEGVKTGLYDFFNKSFTLAQSTGKKFLRMRLKGGANNNFRSFEYNQKFNCLYLLLSKGLNDVEPPFLSRFQKYRFSLKEYRSENSSTLLQKVESFGKRIDEICQSNNLPHYSFNDLFINTSKKALESLVMASFQHVRSGEGKMNEYQDFTEEAYKEAIRRLVLNSGQQFYYLFKLIIEKKEYLNDVKEMINESINLKNENLGQRGLLIRFTNEKNYLKLFADSPRHTSIQFQTLKRQSDLQNAINSFFKSHQQIFSIFMRVLQQSHYLNYIVSQIEKVRKRAMVENDNVTGKKIRIVYLFSRGRTNLEPQNEGEVTISHFSAYSQQFHDGKVGHLGTSKEQMFKTIIKMDQLLNYVHQAFDFTFDNPQNQKKTQTILDNILTELQTNKNSLFQQNCQEITTRLETNFQLTDENLKEILTDKDIVNKFSSFKVAITRHFADRKLFGAIAMFIKYLIEVDSYLSYSEQFLFDYLQSEAYRLDTDKIQEFQKVKRGKDFCQFVKEMLKSKTNHILQDYQKLKQLRRLPTPDKKYSLQMSKPRLIPFSKVQCNTLLNPAEKELPWLAKQVFKNPQKHRQTYHHFVQEFQFKTSFKNKGNNLYSKYLDENGVFKEMMMLDLLMDFSRVHGLSLRYVYRYYNLMRPMLGTVDKLPFARMAVILLGLSEHWVQMFRLLSVFYEQEYELSLKVKQFSIASTQSMKVYCEFILKEIENRLLDPKCIEHFGNADKYSRIFFNVLFQMQKLQPLMGINISSLLKSIRTSLTFLDMFDSTNKAERIEAFIKQTNKDKQFSHYHHALMYFNQLEKGGNRQQKKLITEFKANTLFYEWFRKGGKKDEKYECLKAWIQNCQNQTFAHNSVATINIFVEALKPKYQNILECFDKFNNRDKDSPVIQQLIKIGEVSKDKQFKDNLSIVVVNMFVQKINSESKNKNLLTAKVYQFQQIINLVSTTQNHGVAKHFAFAFLKVYLERYIDSFHQKQQLKEYQRIDRVLSKKQNTVCSNLRLYCLKMLRTKLTLKQIQNQYIKMKKCHWITLIDQIDFFLQNQSRSLVVPKVGDKVTPKLLEIVQSITEREGKADNFDQLFAEGSISASNKYHLLTFFFRYYFSLVYNSKAYKQTVIDKLQQQKNKYEKLIGQVEFQLINRYANNKFDENIQIKDPLEFTEQKFFMFNSINWLLATKHSESPFSSLFFEKGRFHQNFKNTFESLFFPCGPENPFINIAVAQSELTRMKNIGIYICSQQCDYIYSHEDCGWPAETVPCRICGQQIGCKPGKSHTLNRLDEGARRVMSPHLKDSWGFWANQLASLPHFMDAQRCYIEGQVNRMKLKSNVKIGEKQHNLKGYQVQNQGRVSTLVYYVFRQILHSLFYCLCSLKVITSQEAVQIFKGDNIAQVQQSLLQKEEIDITYIKKALNLDSKIYGWIYGVHSYFFELSFNFQTNFNSYVSVVHNRAEVMANQLSSQVNDKKINSKYFEMYNQMAASLRNGMISKELENVSEFSAKNRYTRDVFEQLLQRFIKANTTEQKFQLSEKNAILQGTMQYPNDCFLTEDQIDQTKFQFSRLLKLPDKAIKYSQIVVAFELLIREQYPFLDYILKNSETINSMGDFFTVLSFSNQLFGEVQNTYERKDAEKGLGEFMEALLDKKLNKIHQVLKHPQAVVDAWNRLAKRLGTLQNACTVVGKMNDQYSLQTPAKAFLVDNVSKTNPFGLILSSLYHNFAIIHNDLMNVLNSRKNQIAQFKSLSLYNQSKRISPQQLTEKEVFFITQGQLIDKLYQYSISSVSYGRNFIFTNFQSYQRHFLMKLQGKCEIVNVISDLKSICFNGEAFAQNSESSGVLTEVREFFYIPLDAKDRRQVHRFIKGNKSAKQIAECSIKMRGDIERIMITITNLSGVVGEVNLSQFISQNDINCSAPDLVEFGELEIGKIVPLYQLIQLEMKEQVIRELPDKYKQKLSKDVENQLHELFQGLALENDQQGVSLLDFGQALYRFIARNLQGGIFDQNKNIMEYLPYREDFWPKGFEQYRLEAIQRNPSVSSLTLKHICALFSILEAMIQKKAGASKI